MSYQEFAREMLSSPMGEHVEEFPHLYNAVRDEQEPLSLVCLRGLLQEIAMTEK